MSVVREYDADRDGQWAEHLLDGELAGRWQARRGGLVDALEGDALVGELDGAPVGIVAWLTGGAGSAPDEAEIRLLVVEEAARRTGVGGALLAEAERRMEATGARSAWLVTTNDNLDALRFYQRRGWRFADVFPGAVDEARRTLKSSIGRVAANGIPIRDELVLAKDI